jgi:lipoic acid synthetase/lipoyl(octanoyl) transferase
MSPPGDRTMRRFEVIRRRGADHDEVLRIQLDAVARLREDPAGRGLLLLVEHTPVVTMGRSGSEANLLAGRAGLDAAGVAFREVKRGGDVTYHGPGQITLYPVFPLAWWERDLHAHLRRLESLGLLWLAGHGIEGHREAGLTGVWTPAGKIAAIGIAVSGWVAYYGMSVNIAPDPEHFALIRPCGIEGRDVTSLEAITGRQHDICAEMDRLADCFLEAFPGAVLEGEGRPHG